MSETERSTEWLSLREASALIGVHPSTLRRWADTGVIPCTRTPGGHRRFQRAVLTQYLKAGEPEADQPAPGKTEIALARPSEEEEAALYTLMQREWHAPFVEAEMVARMRELGQRLLGLLLQYLTRQEEDERFLREGHEVGYNYGHESFEANISLLDAVQAFLYFRTNFAQTTSQIPAPAGPADGQENVHLYRRIDRFMNAVLLGLITAYEEARGHAMSLE